MIIKFMMQFIEREFYSGMISERLKIKRRGNVLTFGPFFFFDKSDNKIEFYLHRHNKFKRDISFTCDQMAELLDVLEIREDLKNTVYHKTFISNIKIENVIRYKEFTVPDEWVEKYIIPKINPKKGFVYSFR